MIERVKWSDVRDFSLKRDIPVNFIENADKYVISVFDGSYFLHCEISRTSAKHNIDKIEFESNFKPNGNIKLGQGSFRISSGGSAPNEAIVTDGHLLVDSRENISFGNLPLVDNRLKYEDMSPCNGGASRGTQISSQWITLYKYEGIGIFYSFLISLEKNDHYSIRLITDNIDIFNGSNGICLDDMVDPDKHNIDISNGSLGINGLSVNNKSISLDLSRFAGLKFSDKIEIKIRRLKGSKKFNAGMVSLIKL